MWKNLSTFVTSFVNETFENDPANSSSSVAPNADPHITQRAANEKKTDGHQHQQQQQDARNDAQVLNDAALSVSAHPPSSSSSVAPQQLAQEPAAATVLAGVDTQLSSSPYEQIHPAAESERQVKNPESEIGQPPASSAKDAPEESLSASLFSLLSSASQSLQLEEVSTASADSAGNTSGSASSADKDAGSSSAAADAIPTLSQEDRAILNASSADADSTFLSRRQALEFTQRIASSASSFLSNLKNQTMSVLATSKNEQLVDENGQPIEMFRKPANNEEEIAQLIEALHFQDKQNKLVIKEYNKIIHENESTARQQIGERDAEIRFLRNELTEIQKKLSALEASAKSAQAASGTNEQQASELRAMLADKSEQIKALLQVNRELYSKYSAISSEKPFDPAAASLDEKQLKEEIEKSLQQNAADSAAAANSATAANQNGLIVRIAHALEESTRRLHQRDEEVSQLVASNFSSHQAKYDAQLQSANQQFLSLQAEFEGQSKAWLGKENELKLSEKKLRAALQTMKSELDKNEKLLDDREKLLSQKDEQVFTLETQVADKEQQRKAAESSLKAVQGELSALKASLDDLNEQMLKEQSSSAAVREELRTCKEERKELEDVLLQLKAENERGKSSSGDSAMNAQKEKELQDLLELQKTQLANHTNEVAAMQRQVQRLKSESQQQSEALAAERSAMQIQSTQLSQTHSQRVAQLDSALKEAQAAVNEISSKEKKLAAESDAQLKQLTEESSALKKSLQLKEKEAAEWKAKCDGLQAASSNAGRSSSSAVASSLSSSSAVDSDDPWAGADASKKTAAQSAAAGKGDELDELDELIASFESK